MEVSIKKWGGSAAIRLPCELVTKLKLRVGDKLIAEIRPEGVILIPPRHSYLLSELIAQCDMSAPLPADMAAWCDMPAVGREAF